MSDLDHYLTTAQVAENLGYRVGTLQNWRTRGEGPRYVRIGREVRYRAADVAEWLASKARTVETSDSLAVA